MLVRRDLENYVPIPEGRIYFERNGAGTQVVMFHPLGNSTWVWNAVMDPMSQQFSCFAFDMMGHGQSDKPNGNFSMPDWATAMDHAMQVLNIHRAHIIGNSVGAVLATELAASYPDRVDRLVLVGAPVFGPHTAPQRLKDGAAGYDDDGLPIPRTAEEIRASGSFGNNPRPEWVDKQNETRAQAGVWVKKTMEALSWYDMAARLPHIKATATMVLYGENDRLVEGADYLQHNIPNATKVIMPGLGHIPQVEDPEAFVSVVTDFLS